MKLLLVFFSLLPALAQTGAVRVTVHLDQDPPALPEVLPDKNIDFCGDKIMDPILLVHDRKVANVVVSLDWQDEPPAMTRPEPPKLKGNHCLLEPRIQTTQAGVFLKLNSGDDIPHNPHGWLNDERTVFNLTLLDPTMSFKRKLRKAGRYRIDCDTHNWMRAYIWAFDHPYHTVTAKTGEGLIENIPPGSYTVKIWHEVLGEQTGKVVVEAGKEAVWMPTYTLADHRKEKLKPKTAKPWPGHHH